MNGHLAIGQARQAGLRQIVAWVSGQGPAVELPGGGLVPLRLGDLAQAVIGILALPIARRQRGQIVMPRLHKMPGPAIDIGAVVEGGREIRRQRQSGTVIAKRIVQPAHPIQQQATVEQDPGLFRIAERAAFDCQRVIRQRVGPLPQSFAGMAARHQ